MHSSFKLGRIAGVDIGANWSWLIVFALIAFSLAVRVFPEQSPGLSDEAYVAMAVVAARSVLRLHPHARARAREAGVA